MCCVECFLAVYVCVFGCVCVLATKFDTQRRCVYGYVDRCNMCCVVCVYVCVYCIGGYVCIRADIYFSWVQQRRYSGLCQNLCGCVGVVRITCFTQKQLRYIYIYLT